VRDYADVIEVSLSLSFRKIYAGEMLRLKKSTRVQQVVRLLAMEQPGPSPAKEEGPIFYFEKSTKRLKRISANSSGASPIQTGVRIPPRRDPDEVCVVN